MLSLKKAISAAAHLGHGQAEAARGRRSGALSPPPPLRTRIFARQQEVELVGRISRPGRTQDRHRKTIRRILAGQYHGIDAGGTDIGDVVIVFYRFDDECHEDYRSNADRVSQVIH